MRTEYYFLQRMFLGSKNRNKPHNFISTGTLPCPSSVSLYFMTYFNSPDKLKHFHRSVHVTKTGSNENLFLHTSSHLLLHLWFSLHASCWWRTETQATTVGHGCIMTDRVNLHSAELAGCLYSEPQRKGHWQHFRASTCVSSGSAAQRAALGCLRGMREATRYEQNPTVSPQAWTG